MSGLGPFEQHSTAPADSPRTNQVYLLPVDRPNPEFVSQRQPDGVTFGRHMDFFDEAMSAESFQPIAQAKLPADWDYKQRRSGFHASREQQHTIWAITPQDRYVGPIQQLFDELVTPRPGLPDLVRGALRHSHWEGIRGGAPSTIIVENTLAHKFAKVTVDVVELALALVRDPDDKDRIEYFRGLHAKLGVTA